MKNPFKKDPGKHREKPPSRYPVHKHNYVLNTSTDAVDGKGRHMKREFYQCVAPGDCKEREYVRERYS